MPKMSLSEAGAVLGVSANAVRARAKKSPAIYHLERDNAGKLWVDLDLQRLSELKPSRPEREGSTVKPVKLSNEAEIARLTVEVHAANRARDQAEAERDHWRRMAETLAAKRWRFWPWS